MKGKYFVGNNATAVHGDWLGTGMNGPLDNFMMCNGSTATPLIFAWQPLPPLTVSENTTYKFCAYIINLIPSGVLSNPIIELRVNGTPLFLEVNGTPSGTSANIPATSTWYHITGTWISGPSTFTANLEILSTSIRALGNDFGIDCIQFIECIE